MFVVGFMQMYNEESKGNLKRCLDSFTKIVDHIFIYDDASTDNSVKLATSYKKVSVFPGKKNEFGKEIEHKNYLLNHTLECDPSHILWLDADEVFEKRVEDDNLIRKLAANMDCDAYTFPQVNLWRSEAYFRLDNQYGNGIFTRLWRNNGKLHFNVKDGLHQKQYPNGIGQVRDSELLVLHYGFANDNSILNKYHTYKSHGQDGWALNRLIDETGLTLGKSKHEWFDHEPTGNIPNFPIRDLL